MTGRDSRHLRLTVLGLVAAVLFGALFARLWFLQVLAGERYSQLANSNRVRFVVIEAPRGRVLSTDGTELVDNRPAQTISADRRKLLDNDGEPLDATARATLERLSGLLGMSVDEIVERLTSRRYSPFRPIPIKEDVPPEAIFAVSEQQELFPGVVAETLPVRTYPQGETAAHLVGYLGEISEEQLAREQFADYRLGDLIGQGGLEMSYEQDLHGEEGLRRLEVNAEGTVLQVLDEDLPERGDDVQTTIDLDLQREVEQILEEGIVASRDIERRDGTTLPSVAGSAVVLDPRDGSITAMASWPSFDPSRFVGGVPLGYWEFLNDPGNHFPLLNRAIQSAYPPGSTFKIVSAAAALTADLIGAGTTLECPPTWQFADITFRNWNPRHEGRLALADALMRSCDTYFYELAKREWEAEQGRLAATGDAGEVLPPVAESFGLGDPLGVDLPGERGGIIPGRQWRRAYWDDHKDIYCRKADELSAGSYAQRVNADLCRFGGRWRGGDAVNRSIGQGDVLVTPLQLASAYAAVANGGTLHRPHVGGRVLRGDGTVVRTIDPEPLSTLPLQPAELQAIRTGLRRVVHGPDGTAESAFTGFPLDRISVAGKTGTAEMKPRVPYAWFVAYAPADDPRYVVAVMVEEGGGGSQTAAPIVRRILEAAFDLTRTPFRPGELTE